MSALSRLTPEQRRFLAGARVAHLATADGQGQPTALPVCYALVGDDIFIALDEKPKRSAPHRLRRVRDIVANPRVALVVDEYQEDWSRLRWVLLRGSAEVVEGGQEHARAVEQLRAKYPQYRAMALEGRPLLRMRVAECRSWRATP